MNKDLISRQAAIEALKAMAIPLHLDLACEDIWERDRTIDNAIDIMRGLPSAQPALDGYNIEHLKLIAEVLIKENLPPERVVEALTDISRIISIVKSEFSEALRKAVCGNE